MNIYLTEKHREATIAALDMTSRWLCGDVNVFLELIEDGKFKDKRGKTATSSYWLTHIEPALLSLGEKTLDVSVSGDLHPLDPGAPPRATKMHLWMQQLQQCKNKKHSTIAAMPYERGFEKTDSDSFTVYKKGLNPQDPYTASTLPDDMGLSAQDLSNRYKTRGYLLNVSNEDIHTLMNALDLYSRLLMGQWEELIDINAKTWFKKEDVSRSDLERYIETFKSHLIGFDSHASHGIHSPHIHEHAQISYNVMKSLRHADYVLRNGYEGGTIDTDPPQKKDSWPLIDTCGPGLQTMPVGSFLVGNESRFSDRFYLFESIKDYPHQQYITSSYSPVSCLDSFLKKQASYSAQSELKP